MRLGPRSFLLLLATLLLLVCANASADESLTIDQVVRMALLANPQVRGARDRWHSASHSVLQNYAPVDPQFQFMNVDSPTNPFANRTEQSFVVTQALQFPGKGYLQAQNASRTADIARLSYDATVRDVRAQAETEYYQILLDEALLGVETENVANLRQVLKVTQIAYTANQVSQADVLSAKFNLTNEEQTQRQFVLNLANDKAALNQTLFRRADEPVVLRGTLELQPLEAPVDDLVARAKARRQEILEAALTEHNAETALTLAKLEYAPDYTIGYEFDHFLIPSAGPNTTLLQDHTLMIGINVPIFFWLHQREDNVKAGYDLSAAREDLGSVINQTEIQVVTLYRQAQFSYQTALLYRNSQIPMAAQAFRVALVAYASGKLDFFTLINTFRQLSASKVANLQNINQFLAQEFAIEQAIGSPLIR
jgi:outer membrane protein, heavy metal efflux system